MSRTMQELLSKEVKVRLIAESNSNGNGMKKAERIEIEGVS